MMASRLFKIRGKEVALPISEGALYRDAFHGTSIDRAQTIAAGGFKPSRKGWYGPGVYFWLGDMRAAIWYARNVKQFRSTWAVLEAVVDSGRTLHVDQIWDDSAGRGAVEDANWAEAREKGWKNPDIRSKVAALCLLALDKEGIMIDSVFYFETLRDLGRPVRALCVRTLGRIKSCRILGRDQIPWRLGEDES